MKIYFISGSFMDYAGGIDALIARIFASKSEALGYLQNSKLQETVYASDLQVGTSVSLVSDSNEEVFSGVYAESATQALKMREGAKKIVFEDSRFFVVEY